MSVFLTHDSTLRNTFLKDVNLKQWFSTQLITGVLEGALTHVQIPGLSPGAPDFPAQRWAWLSVHPQELPMNSQAREPRIKTV